jgi:DNA-binding transcriptional regulator YiaG
MKCFECDETIEIIKYRAFNYAGVGLSNITLFNVEVEYCKSCNVATPLLRNMGKIHRAIAIAIALQESPLFGHDIRYLRRISRFSVDGWAKGLRVSKGTYEKWESNQRSVSGQADKLARIIFLDTLTGSDIPTVKLSEYMRLVLAARCERVGAAVICIDAENPEVEAKYLTSGSNLLANPSTSYIEAKTLKYKPLRSAVLFADMMLKPTRLSKGFFGEKHDVCYELATSA